MIGSIIYNFSVVSQSYTVMLVDENVLRGNAAIVKCLIPSFVTEYVSVASWIISEGDDETEIKANDTVNKEGIPFIYKTSCPVLFLKSIVLFL